MWRRLCLVCAAGLGACIFIGIDHPTITMIALIIGIMGQQSIAPTFWALPTAMLSGTAAAGGIALINSVGNLGGFLGPYMFGLVKDPDRQRYDRTARTGRGPCGLRHRAVRAGPRQSPGTYPTQSRRRGVERGSVRATIELPLP